MALDIVGRRDLDDAAIYGHLLLWDPWWILGGGLFAAAGYGSLRAARDRARP